VVDAQRHIPFELKRTFYLFGTPEDTVRGQHAHQKLVQAAVCIRGSVQLKLDDGKDRASVRLDRPDKALLLEPMVWIELSDFSPDCVLLVLADDAYDENDYIRSYPEFLTALSSTT